MARQATEVDWNAIEVRVRAMKDSGETYRQIAEDHPISHVSIRNRAVKEGWTIPRVVNRAVKRAAPAIDKQHCNSKMTEGTLAELLDALSKGRSIETAAATAGIGRSTVHNWAKDPDVAEAIRIARMASLGAAEQSLYDAHERGDWKAAVARLQAAPELREQWADQGKGSGGITVVVNVQRDDQVTIEGEKTDG